MAEPAPAPSPAPAPANPVHAVAPDGSNVLIRPGMEAKAASMGFRLQTADEFAAEELSKKEGLAGAAKTAIANVAKGATLGLSDVVGGAIGGDEFRRSRALHDLAYSNVAPIASGVGAVLPAFIPGGAVAEGAEAATALGRAGELAATIGRNTPAGLAMRGGEAVSGLVGRGLESAGLGGGESLLGRVASTGLKMAAGGAAEGAAYGAGEALSEAALAPGGDYDSLAQKLWAGAIHGAEFGALAGGGLGAGGELLGGAARKLAGNFHVREELERIANEKTLKSVGLRPDDIAELHGAGRAGELGDAIRSVDEIGALDTRGMRASKVAEAADATRDVLSTMRKGLDDVRAPGEGVDIGNAIDRWEQKSLEIENAAKSDKGNLYAANVGTKIYEFKKAIPEGERASFQAVDQLRRDIDELIQKYRDAAPNAAQGSSRDVVEQEMMRLRTDIEGQAESAANRVMDDPRVTQEFRDQYMAARDRNAALTEAADIGKRRLSEAGQNALLDTITGAAGLVSMGPKGILMAAAHRAMRSAPADALVGQLLTHLTRLDERVGSSMGKWAAAARKAAVEPATIQKIANRGRSVATTGGRNASDFSTHQERTKQYFSKLDAVEREANSPPGTLVHIPDSPKTQEAAENVRRRQAQWLMSEAPAHPAQIKNPVMARLARQTPPNPSEVATWMLKVKTIEDPESALISFEKGELKPAQVKALEQTPALLDKFRQAAIEQVTDKNSDISYESRIQLGVLLGVVTDPSLRPESVALSQQTYTQMRQESAQQQKQQGPPAPSAPGKPPTRGSSSRVDSLEEGNL